MATIKKLYILAKQKQPTCLEMTQSYTIQPSPGLSSLVRHILVMDHQTTYGVVTPLPFYADGLPGIVFQQSSGNMYLNDKNRKLSSLFLYGQTIRPIPLLPYGSFRMIVFLLYPSAISRLFGIRSNEVTDDCVDLRLLPTANLLSDYQALTETADSLIQIDIISQYLITISNAIQVDADNIVHYALEHIIASKGQTSLRDLRMHLHITDRTFERKFEHRNYYLIRVIVLQVCPIGNWLFDSYRQKASPLFLCRKLFCLPV